MNIKFNKNIEKNITLLSDNLPNLENRIYLVGGIVRDTILNIDSEDMDFCVDCDIEYLVNELKRVFNIPIVINKKFFSAKCEINNIRYEFTSARCDFYNKKSRYPIRCERVNIEQDSFRRDFNINTLMVNIYKPYEIIDYIGKGLEDLENRIINTPIDSIVSFNEDPLRMLRAIRFATRFDFKIENRLLNSIETCGYRLEILSKTLIKKEIDKMNCKGLEMIEELGLLNRVNL